MSTEEPTAKAGRSHRIAATETLPLHETTGQTSDISNDREDNSPPMMNTEEKMSTVHEGTDLKLADVSALDNPDPTVSPDITPVLSGTEAQKTKK